MSGLTTRTSRRLNLVVVDKVRPQTRARGALLHELSLNFAQIYSALDDREALDTLAEVAADGLIVCLDGMDEAIFALITKLAKLYPGLPLIAISSNTSIKLAVQAMQCGLADFLIEPVTPAALAAVLNKHVENDTGLAVDFGSGDALPQACTQFEGFIGTSAPMQLAYDTIEKAARSQAPAFITGESGTGKELCTQALHRLSNRCNRPLITLNCSAIPRELMESEIFGHEKGAFTGAYEARAGAAELADGGILFLDEICDMDLALQAKFLRFTQSGSFRKVGGVQTKHVDVRFVCATNKDPIEAVRQGVFREDLLYRLHVLPINLPPLREREDDIVAIANQALVQYAREEGKNFSHFDAQCEHMLENYAWPGNVRELLNVIRNIVVIHDGPVATAQMLPLALARSARETAHAPLLLSHGPSEVARLGEASPLLRPIWQQERDIIEQAIVLCDGNIAKAAACLEISASTIYRKRQTWLEQGAA